MTQHYFNSNNLSGDDLANRDELAQTQEAKILRLYQSDKDHDFTPFEVWRMIFDESTPITSVRRSITNLTSQGLLVKTDVQRQGEFGNVCYAWRAV